MENCLPITYLRGGVILQSFIVTQTKSNQMRESNRSDEGLTLETSAFELFSVANLRYQLSWLYYITLLYSPTNAVPQFL